MKNYLLLSCLVCLSMSTFIYQRQSIETIYDPRLNSLNWYSHPLYYSTNMVSGRDNYINGQYNNVNGYYNGINGNYNSLQGNSNQVNGFGNNVQGYGNQVTGQYNTVQGGQNIVTGLNNQMGTSSNIVQGSGNSVFGSGNTVTSSGSVPSGQIVPAIDDPFMRNLYRSIMGKDIDMGSYLSNSKGTFWWLISITASLYYALISFHFHFKS